ncbi:MAG: hypothetical protein JWM90_1530 [Thermoleophilia bacterium]|nr:hypothetical protein [Thermoleophilia bacterium]
MTVRTKLYVGGVLLGIGFGGFIDGIVLHQILQWHHMLSDHSSYPVTTVAGLEVNTLWDGIFHSATWTAALGGLFLTWHALRGSTAACSTRAFVGLLLLGWGSFNLVEGTVNHHILGIHHVNETVPEAQWLAWDLGFLAFGATLATVGATLARRPNNQRITHTEDTPA